MNNLPPVLYRKKKIIEIMKKKKLNVISKVFKTKMN